MNKKQSSKIVYSTYAIGWSGGETVYESFRLVLHPNDDDSDEVASFIQGSAYSYKMQVAKKFLIDGKKSKVTFMSISFKGDEKDEEFFEIAKTLPARKWEMWKQAWKIFESRRNRNKVLEYLVSQAVAKKLSR